MDGRSLGRKEKRRGKKEGKRKKGEREGERKRKERAAQGVRCPLRTHSLARS